MKELIIPFAFLFITTNLNAQIQTSVQISPDFFSGSKPLTKEDSMMLDSINRLFSNYSILFSTIASIDNSNFSERLKDIVFDKYVLTFDRTFDYNISFILKYLKDFEFLEIPTSANVNSSNAQNEIILKNKTLRNLIATRIIESEYLDNCDLLDMSFLNSFNTRYSPPDIYEIRKNNFIRNLAFLLCDNVDNLKLKSKTSTFSCLLQNINTLIEFGSKDPFLKHFYH